MNTTKDPTELPATFCSPFRAGDVVKHQPTGEEWILANDQTGKDVSPCGWPECWAEAAHCELVKAATDEERLRMLQNWAKITDPIDQRDHRIRDARTQLEANVSDQATANTRLRKRDRRPMSRSSPSNCSVMWYACWQNPDWQRAFRKGPMSKKAATDACRDQWKRRPMALMWLQSETGERELYSPNE